MQDAICLFHAANLIAVHHTPHFVVGVEFVALGKEANKPPALMWIGGTALAHGKPLIASEAAKAPAKADDHGPSIADEGVGETDVHP
jgi:hypothetical protein